MSSRTIYINQTDLVRLRLAIAKARAQDEFEDQRQRPYLDELSRDLQHAVVLTPGQRAPEVVTLHTRLRIRDGEHAWTMRLVFPDDADPQSGHISVLAPLGAAVLGGRAGDLVRFALGDGQQRSCGIVSILYQPEAVRSAHCRVVGCR